MASHVRLDDAALAVGVVVYETARLPLGLVKRLPGMHWLAGEGAFARMRLRSALEGRIDRVLSAPEVERAIDRVLAGHLPDVIVRSLVDHEVLKRLAAELAVDPAGPASEASPGPDDARGPGEGHDRGLANEP